MVVIYFLVKNRNIIVTWNFKKMKFFLKIPFFVLLFIFFINKKNIFFYIQYYFERGIFSVTNTINNFYYTTNNFFLFLKYYKFLIKKNFFFYENSFFKEKNSLQIKKIEQENTLLRKLLGFPLQKKVFYKIIYIILYDYDHNELIVSYGNKKGAYPGQIIVSQSGIIGKIISINKELSRILLICNKKYAFSVKLIRNNIVFIVNGNGCKKELEIINLPKKAFDIKIGDILVTSLENENIYQNYPIGKISSIKINEKKQITLLKMKTLDPFTGWEYLFILHKNN